MVVGAKAKRVGLLATQGIRGGANRRVLEHITQCGGIFWAQSDREWVLDGAMVHISMIGFDDGTEESKELDGAQVAKINADLTATADLTKALRLKENLGIAFIGDTKKGKFDIPASLAREMLAALPNPNGKTNHEVLRRWVNGLDITQRPRGMWIIDFGVDMTEEEASLFEIPFNYIRSHVKPARDKVRNTRERSHWWLHGRAAPELRAAVSGLQRYIATPRVSKHRIFVYLDSETLPDGQIVIFARDDSYLFGVLHSRIHELWARGTGTQLREAESGFRYSQTFVFETFPFPWPLGNEPVGDPLVEAIARAANELVEYRDRWLNPTGATSMELKDRALTRLYNERPAWLQLVHQRLDTAVLDAYGWPHDVTDEEILHRLLALNLERASSQGFVISNSNIETEDD